MTDERSVRERLQDARHFAYKAHELLDTMSFSILKDVDYYQHAARSYLIIVGEALRSVPEPVARANPQIPWAMIKGMRNRLVHAYWRVDLDIVYRAAREHAPDLVAKLDALIEASE